MIGRIAHNTTNRTVRPGDQVTIAKTGERVTVSLTRYDGRNGARVFTRDGRVFSCSETLDCHHTVSREPEA